MAERAMTVRELVEELRRLGEQRGWDTPVFTDIEYTLAPLEEVTIEDLDGQEVVVL